MASRSVHARVRRRNVPRGGPRRISRDAHGPNARTHACTHGSSFERAPCVSLPSLRAPPPPRPVSPRRCLVLPLFSRRKARACAYARTSATRPSSAALLPPPRLSSPRPPHHATELQLSVAQWLSTRPRVQRSRARRATFRLLFLLAVASLSFRETSRAFAFGDAVPEGLGPSGDAGPL